MINIYVDDIEDVFELKDKYMQKIERVNKYLLHIPLLGLLMFYFVRRKRMRRTINISFSKKKVIMEGWVKGSSESIEISFKDLRMRYEEDSVNPNSNWLSRESKLLDAYSIEKIQDGKMVKLLDTNNGDVFAVHVYIKDQEKMDQLEYLRFLSEYNERF